MTNAILLEQQPQGVDVNEQVNMPSIAKITKESVSPFLAKDRLFGCKGLLIYSYASTYQVEETAQAGHISGVPYPECRSAKSMKAMMLISRQTELARTVAND